MSKPLLLSSGQGKVQELVGTATGQTVVWSEGPDEWVLGTPSSSGGGGVTWYLNENTAAGSPTTNLPTGASGVVVKNLSATADGTSTTATSTASLPVLPAAPEIIAGFVTDATVPGLTGIPAGLWDFNIWAQANGNTTNQSYIQFKVYKYNGATAPTFIAQSVPVYLYDPGDVTQYTASVLIPAGTSLLATDRIYVEVVGGSTTANRQITLHFGNGEPSHVHTTIQVPVNLATGVSGILPVANGGTNAATAAINTVFAGPSSGSTGAPLFRSLVAADLPTVTIAKGGTNLTSYTLGDLLYASATDTLAKRGIGSTGNVLTVVAGVPTWAAPATSGTVTSVSTVDTGMGLTLTTANGTTTPQITLAGTLAVTKGGTGQTSYATGDLLYADSTTSLAKLSDVATGNALISGGVSTAPSWGKIGLTTHVSGTLGVGNGGTGATTLTQYGVLVGNATTAVGVTAVGTSGQYLKSGAGAANPSFATIQASEVSAIPYDLPCEIPGVPDAVVKKVVNFKAVRAFVLATTGHQGGQLSAPSGDFVCTVRKNATSLGTITFGVSSFSSSITGTLAERTFAATDVLSVETPSAALGIDTPFFTLSMTLA